MTEPNFLELALKGDPQAIASLLNCSLQPKGVTVEAILKDACLQVWLKSNRVLDQQVLVAFIRKRMMSLRAESITTVRVYAQQTCESFPDWTEEFRLGDIAFSILLFVTYLGRSKQMVDEMQQAELVYKTLR